MDTLENIFSNKTNLMNELNNFNITKEQIEHPNFEQIKNIMANSSLPSDFEKILNGMPGIKLPDIEGMGKFVNE